METLLGPDLTGDYMLSFELHDGFYVPGINPADCDYFIVNEPGQL
jgi:hypothetical protein